MEDSNMRRLSFLGIVVVGTLLLFPDGASACSENVFRPGQGMAYRKLATSMPARVLIEAGAGQGITQERAVELQAGLSEAGHTVVVATDARMRTTALSTDSYDIVITGSDSAAELASGRAQGRPVPAALPVLRRGQNDEAALRQKFGQVLSPDPGLRQTLKAIERLMESRLP
jgi:hypothetical protein